VCCTCIKAPTVGIAPNATGHRVARWKHVRRGAHSIVVLPLVGDSVVVGVEVALLAAVGPAWEAIRAAAGAVTAFLVSHMKLAAAAVVPTTGTNGEGSERGRPVGVAGGYMGLVRTRRRDGGRFRES